jgi:hypothetical protein
MKENTVEKQSQNYLLLRKIILYILGIVEAFLAFRLVLKLFGANSKSIFVSFIYSITQTFLIPFVNIFKTTITKGYETNIVLEPNTIIAMLVYALLAWGLVKLIEIFKYPHKTDNH